MAEYGVIFVMYIGLLVLSASQEKKCDKEGEEKYYDRYCYTTLKKPTEVEKQEVTKEFQKIESPAVSQ